MTKRKWETLIRPGKWTEEELDHLIREASEIEVAGQRIAFISEKFLGTPYRSSTLVGDASTPETLVIDLGGVDCFTFIDYVEAMRLSASSQSLRAFMGFRRMLERIRYKGGIVSFDHRNHFFTDWSESNRPYIEDATEAIGGKRSRRETKRLNEVAGGTLFLRNIPPVERLVSYIPAGAIDGSMMEDLRTGDYVGVYSSEPWLDVSHAGILIKSEGTTLFRHASSQERFRKVIDQDFREYVAGGPGVLVLRPK